MTEIEQAMNAAQLTFDIDWEFIRSLRLRQEKEFPSYRERLDNGDCEE